MKKPGLLGRWLGKLRAAAVTPTARNRMIVQPDSSLYNGLEYNDAGVAVTTTNAMQHDTVWACVRLIAESLAMMPLHLMIRDPKRPQKATKHALYDLLLYSPNTESTAYLFWEAVVTAMLLQGNAYVEIKRYNGQISSLMFLAPNRLTVVKDLNGNKRFFYRDDDGKSREIGRAKVWQLQGYSLDGKDGCSVIEYANKVIGGAMAAERSAARTFWNGMMQAVYYTVQAFLTEEQREAFREHVVGTVERGQTPILEGGTDVKSIQIKPSDAQLLESRSYSVEQICRWFRVPPSMVGHNEKSTSWGTGIEQQVLGFLQFTMTPWLTRIEQSISKDLLTPAERTRYYPKFDVKALMRADSGARAKFYDTMVKGAMMTPDEARAEEGLPILGGNASKLLIQGAMVRLDDLGQQNVVHTSEGNRPPTEEEKTLAALARFHNSARDFQEGLHK